MGKSTTAKVATTPADGAGKEVAGATPTATAVALTKAAGVGKKYAKGHQSQKVGVEIKGHYVLMLKDTAAALGLQAGTTDYFLDTKNRLKKAQNKKRVSVWLNSHLKDAPMLSVAIPTALNDHEILSFFDDTCKSVYKLRMNGKTYNFDRKT